jgi:nucleoside-diphosphate-sugar epimerase
MSIIVSGATGFLGGRYAITALGRGETVVAIGRDADKLQKLEDAGAIALQCDLSLGFDAKALQVFRDVDRSDPVQAIVHCAALSSPFGARRSFEEANVAATKTICDLAKDLPQARLINISTPAIYASPEDRLNVAESGPLPKPINHYAATKFAAELVVMSELADRAITLRPRGIYGAGDNALLPRMMKTAQAGPLPLFRDGVAETDITHVDDVVRAIDASRDAPGAACGSAYNISGGEAMRITDIIKAAAARSGTSLQWKRIPVRPVMLAARLMEAWAALGGWKSEPRATPYSIGILAFSQTLDISLAKEKLGWAPQVSFEQGVTEAFSGRDPWVVQK